jgi:ABC-type multidrug transport system fused ATPase/permease subunit
MASQMYQMKKYKADLIIVLENGRIIEKGTHQELLESGSLYSQLWNKQSREQKK